MHPESLSVKWKSQPMEEHRPKKLWNQVRASPELAEGLIIMAQAALVVVDEHAGSDVRQYNTLHGIYKGQSPLCGIPLVTPPQKTSVFYRLTTTATHDILSKTYQPSVC